MVKQPPDRELSAWLEVAPQKLAAKLAEWGIIDQRHVPHGKTLLDHVKDFRQSIVDGGSTEMHADTALAPVRNVAQGCKFNFYSDISASAIHEFLADCRRGGLRNG